MQNLLDGANPGARRQKSQQPVDALLFQPGRLHIAAGESVGQGDERLGDGRCQPADQPSGPQRQRAQGNRLVAREQRHLRRRCVDVPADHLHVEPAAFNPGEIGDSVRELRQQLRADAVHRHLGNVVDEQRHPRHGLGDLREVGQQGVVGHAEEGGRDDHDGVGAHAGSVAGEGQRLGRRVGAGVQQDGHATGRSQPRRFVQPHPLAQGEHQPFAGRAADEQAAHAALDQKIDEVRHDVGGDGIAIVLQRRRHGGQNAAFQPGIERGGLFEHQPSTGMGRRPVYQPAGRRRGG